MLKMIGKQANQTRHWGVKMEIVDYGTVSMWRRHQPCEVWASVHTSVYMYVFFLSLWVWVKMTQ